MNRRDLILSGALGLAAVGASAKAQTAKAAQSGAAPVGARGVAIPTNYGHVFTIPFTTSTDLNAFMPPGLEAVHPHRAFIKAERIKIRSPEADAMPPSFTQYHQLCITTMATAPGFGERQRNILMWEDRPWAVGGSMLAVKRWADIQMTEIFEGDRRIVEQGGSVPFHINVWLKGVSLMSFAGQLDGKQRSQLPPYPGFFVGGDPGQELLAMDLAAHSFSRPMYGAGELVFGEPTPTVSARRVAPGGTSPFEQNAPPGPGKNWSASLLKDIKVEGVLFNEFSFTRARGSEFKLVRAALPGNGRSRL